MVRGPFLALTFIFFLIVLVGGVVLFLTTPKEAVAPPPKIEQFVVAKGDLAWGTMLTADMVELKSKEEVERERERQGYSPGDLPGDLFFDVVDLKGRVLRANLRSQELILEFHLAPRGARPGVDAVLDPEKRAMAVKVDQEVAVAGFIRPGDRVDVLVTMQKPGKQKQTVTKTVLENVRVLAIGTQMQVEEEKGEATPVTVMTLEVSPEGAEKLTLATTRGRLRLVLRSSYNSEKILTPGITAQTLLDSLSPPRPRPSRKTKRTVEIIKGAVTSKKTFK